MRQRLSWNVWERLKAWWKNQIEKTVGEDSQSVQRQLFSDLLYYLFVVVIDNTSFRCRIKCTLTLFTIARNEVNAFFCRNAIYAYKVDNDK